LAPAPRGADAQAGRGQDPAPARPRAGEARARERVATRRRGLGGDWSGGSQRRRRKRAHGGDAGGKLTAVGYLGCLLSWLHPVRHVGRRVKRAVTPRPIRRALRTKNQIFHPIESMERSVFRAVDRAVTPRKSRQRRSSVPPMPPRVSEVRTQSLQDDPTPPKSEAKPQKHCSLCGGETSRLWAVTRSDRPEKIRVCRACADKIESGDPETTARVVKVLDELHPPEPPEGREWG